MAKVLIGRVCHCCPIIIDNAQIRADFFRIVLSCNWSHKIFYQNIYPALAIRLITALIFSNVFLETIFPHQNNNSLPPSNNSRFEKLRPLTSSALLTYDSAKMV